MLVVSDLDFVSKLETRLRLLGGLSFQHLHDLAFYPYGIRAAIMTKQTKLVRFTRPSELLNNTLSARNKACLTLILLHQKAFE